VIVWRTAARTRAASGLPLASRFASDRINSRSASSPRISKRARPRLRRRLNVSAPHDAKAWAFAVECAANVVIEAPVNHRITLLRLPSGMIQV
jgi:hypothetical protein